MDGFRVSLIAALALSFTAGQMASAGPNPGKPAAPRMTQPAWSLAGDCYPIDFTNIDIQWYAGRGVHQLTVSGMKPYTNMQVSLTHEAYNGRPACWRTVVVGCVKNGLLMPISAPYNITMMLDRFVGTRGIEIVGASRAVRRAIPRS
jgi:hypothetical protein